MAKDQKGHGSSKRTLGQTGRTAKEYEAHLRASGSPETMARKKAAEASKGRPVTGSKEKSDGRFKGEGFVTDKDFAKKSRLAGNADPKASKPINKRGDTFRPKSGS